MTADRAYNVYIKSSAEKQLKTLPRHYQEKITKEILSLGENPRPSGVKKLSGLENHYRVRVRPFRIIYNIIDDKLIVVVIRIGARKDAYRGI